MDVLVINRFRCVGGMDWQLGCIAGNLDHRIVFEGSYRCQNMVDLFEGAKKFGLSMYVSFIRRTVVENFEIIILP